LNQIDINNQIKRISDRWYILAALMIIGGLLGFLISMAKTPIFESSAVFSVTIDYTQTGALTDIQEDQAMRGVGSVIFSDKVINKTLSQISKESESEISREDFLENSFLDREEFRWTLRYRDSDPINAEKAINAWATNADSVIQEGLKHSLTAVVMLEDLEVMKNCLIDISNENTQSNCAEKDLDSLVISINEISTRIQEEKTASFGLFNALSVSLVNKGSSSQMAVLGQRNLLVISSALIGFLLSIIAIAYEEMKRSTSI
jgi:hypothetical protein